MLVCLEDAVLLQSRPEQGLLSFLLVLSMIDVITRLLLCLGHVYNVMFMAFKHFVLSVSSIIDNTTATVALVMCRK